MFDTIAETVRTETAIHGRKGITPTELWEIVGKTVSRIACSVNEKYASNPPLIDDAYKRCFWPIVLKDKQLEFYEDLNAIVEETSESQPLAETAMEAQPSTSTAPSKIATEPEENTVTEESEPVKPTTSTKTKTKSSAKKAKAPAKKAAKKSTKKPTKKKVQKKAKKTVVHDDDDDYSSDGYEPPSDGGESTDDEDEFEEEESDEDEAEEESEEEKATQPTRNPVNIEDLLQSNTNTNYRRIQNVTELSYDQVQKTYGERLRIVAEEELQTEQLYVGIPPTGRSLSTNLKIVLATILQTGAHGITQADVTKVLDLDPRSSGHYVKTLELKGTITRKPVAHKGFRTNLCVHIRYSKHGAVEDGMQENEAHNINALGIAFTSKRLRTRLIDLLINAKDHVMYTDDILNALGFNARKKLVKKWYHRAIDDMCSRNVIRKVLGSNSTAGSSRCIQLVDPEEAAKELKISLKSTSTTYRMDLDDEMRVKGGAGLVMRVNTDEQQAPSGQYYDSTVESQIVDVLAAAGTKGVTQKEIMFALSFGEQKGMHRTLEIMESVKNTPDTMKYRCCRDFEFEKRIRRYRYYSHQAYQKLKEDVDIEVTGPPQYEIATSKLKEVDFRTSEGILGLGPTPDKDSAKQTKLKTTKAPRQRRENTEHQKDESIAAQEDVSQSSSSQTANLASIFQRKPKTARSNANEVTGENDATMDESVSCEETTRKRTRRVSLATEPVVKKRGRPRKEALNATSRASQTSASTEPPASSESQAPTELRASKTRSRAASTSAPVEPPAKKRLGRPPKKSLDATPTPSQSSAPVEPSASEEPPATEEPTAPSEPLAAAEPPVKKKRGRAPNRPSNVTSTSSQQSAPAEPPVKKRRGRPPKKPLDATPTSSQPQENVDGTESQPSEQTEMETTEQAPEPPAVSESPSSNQLPAEASVSSRRRGNLFDYFASSRNSPGASSTKSSQSSQQTVSELLPSTPGSSDQQTEYQPITQEDTSQQTAKPSSSTDNLARNATPATNTDKPITRKRLENVIGENIIRYKSGIISARHVRTTQNLYKEQRKSVLLAMLESQPVYERSYEMRIEFSAKMKEMYPKEANRTGLCLKTLWRSARELDEEGLAHVVDTTFTGLSGQKTIRSILVRKGMDLNGPEVQKHVTYTKDRHSLRPASHKKLPKYVKLDSEVERLKERLERMEEEYSTLDKNQEVQRAHLDEEIKGLKANMTKASVHEQALIQDIKPSTRNWLMIATQFGYVNARMIRIKLLHQYMFGLLSQDIQGVDQETSTIRTTTLMSWMPLKMYCQFVPVSDPEKEVLEYFKDSENMEKRIWELSVPIRRSLFTSAKYFRRHMRIILDIMKTLGLVKPVFSEAFPRRENDSPCALSDYYQVQTKVSMVDYRTEDIRITNEYNFTSPSDLMIYWSELQYIYTNPESPLTPKNIHCLSPEVQALVKTLSAAKNWTTNHIITRALRDKLNAYIDKTAMTTPNGNLRLCKQIAEELKVPELLVEGYFRKMDRAFERKRQVHDDRVLMKRLESDVKGRRRTPRNRRNFVPHGINVDTTRVFQRTTRGSTRRRLLLANKTTEDTGNGGPDTSNLFLDDEHEMPIIENSSQVESFRLRRLDRTKWDSSKDELLLYCYVIMKHHARINDKRFIWSASLALFPGRSSSSCRCRMDKLRQTPSISEYIFHLVTLWSEIYQQGLKEGAFEAEGHEAVNYDLLARLSYFIKRLQTVESDIAVTRAILPRTIKEVRERFNVTCALPAPKIKILEDRFHSNTTFKSRNTTLISSFLTLKCSQIEKLDNLVPEIDNQDSKAVDLLKSFFKMTLLTPMEVYDPFFAYAVINKRPSNTINVALNTMHQSGMIVKPKGERLNNRRLPGTFFTISKKFLHEMACGLPRNFFLQAKEYKRFLKVHGKTLFMPILVSSGMMGCILDMISQDKLELMITDEGQVRQKHQIPTHKHRKRDESTMDFDLELELANMKPTVDDIKDEGPLLDVYPKPSEIASLTPEQVEIEWSGFYSSQTLSLQPLLKAIMDLLQEVREAGATLVEIKNKILETLPDVKDREIHDCMNLLRSTRPPLIHLVGFNSLRYVTTAHLEDWVIETRRLNTIIPTSSELSDLAERLSEKRAEVIDPRIWIDVNGNVTTMVLEECLHVVFQRVMERPGILEREIGRLFDDLLTYAEVKDLLEILIGRGAIRKSTLVFTGPLKRTMFSKPRKFTHADADTIDISAQTSYFPQPGYYQEFLATKS